DRPIDNADADGGGNPCQRGAFAGGEREGDGENGHDQRDQRIGNLLLQLDAQTHHVKSALFEIVNVAAQFFVAHFRRLFNFLLEVGGRFRQFGVSGGIELAVVLDGGAAQAALPSLLVNPPAHGVRPVRAIGGDAMGDLESVRIELKYGDAAEDIAVGVEELIV